MDPEIICKECIKPSSPTPLHKKIHKLSLLDQFFFHGYFPTVLYYPFNQNKNFSDQAYINVIVSERLQLLKKSLSETLNLFYPFAGKFKDNLSIDCNDEGIYFIEARVKSSLNEFLDNPDLGSIYKFIPFDASEQNESITGHYVGKIQVTRFACGGLVVSACLSHLFGDGKTLCSFMRSWAARACGNTQQEAVVPDTDASFLFPQNEQLPKETTWMERCAPFYKTGVFVTQRFVFDAKAIAKLKAKATSSHVRNPTRVEVVSALFSKCFMDSPTLKTKSGNSHKPILVTHAVNLRPKADPPMSEYSMGNIALPTNTILCSDFDQEVDSGNLVLQLRETIMKINGDFVKSLQGEKGILAVCESAREEREVCRSARERLTFTCWCNFGSYDVDFGWGKPIWVSNVGLYGPVPQLSNTIALLDTRFREGIEAWAYLLEEDMKILESDKELLAFATLNPSPLK